MMMFKANEKPGGFRLKDSYLLSSERLSIVRRKFSQVMLRSRACTMFDVEFQELTATIESRGHESLTNSVHLVLCDPPYNIRREKEKENSGHDILTKADIDDAVLFDDVLAKDGHGIVFCSTVQFHDWYESLSTWVLSDEENSQGSSAESGRAQTQRLAFHVEQRLSNREWVPHPLSGCRGRPN